MPRPEYRPWIIAAFSLLYLASSVALLFFYLHQAGRLTQYLVQSGENVLVAVSCLAFIGLAVVFFVWALFRLFRPALAKCHAFIRKSHESF